MTDTATATKKGMAAMVMVAAGLAASLTACAREGDLTGEVFIATQGGTNVKLGLVTVKAYPSEVMDPHILKRRTEATKQLAVLSPVLSQLKTDVEAAAAAVEKLKDPQSNYLLNDRLYTQYRAASRTFDDLLQKRINATGAARALGEGAFYVQALPSPVASAKTNADGQFTLRLRPGRYALVGHGQRKVGDSEEEYYWLTWVTFGGRIT
jgi:hypothetical protein